MTKQVRPVRYDNGELRELNSNEFISANYLGYFNYVSKTANYTIQEIDFTVDCTSNTFTLTLPTAVGKTGKVYNLKNSGTGIITLNTTSSQTIDGNASGTLTLIQYDNLSVQSNGSNWIIL